MRSMNAQRAMQTRADTAGTLHGRCEVRALSAAAYSRRMLAAPGGQRRPRAPSAGRGCWPGPGSRRASRCVPWSPRGTTPAPRRSCPGVRGAARRRRRRARAERRRCCGWGRPCRRRARGGWRPAAGTCMWCGGGGMRAAWVWRVFGGDAEHMQAERAGAIAGRRRPLPRCASRCVPCHGRAGPFCPHAAAPRRPLENGSAARRAPGRVSEDVSDARGDRGGGRAAAAAAASSAAAAAQAARRRSVAGGKRGRTNGHGTDAPAAQGAAEAERAAGDGHAEVAAQLQRGGKRRDVAAAQRLERRAVRLRLRAAVAPHVPRGEAEAGGARAERDGGDGGRPRALRLAVLLKRALQCAAGGAIAQNTPQHGGARLARHLGSVHDAEGRRAVGPVPAQAER